MYNATLIGIPPYIMTQKGLSRVSPNQITLLLIVGIYISNITARYIVALTRNEWNFTRQSGPNYSDRPQPWYYIRIYKSEIYVNVATVAVSGPYFTP